MTVQEAVNKSDYQFKSHLIIHPYTRQCEQMKSIGRPRYRRDVKEIRYQDGDWIQLAQDRVIANTVWNFLNR
jgi:hypothetical protein